ncbi:MAG TPA: hypothetical protein VI011_14045 [Asanoa sp.]
MSTTQILVLVIVIVLVVAIAVFAWTAVRRRGLRERFGPEYDRVVAETDSRTAAERELRERERRHAELTLTPLSEESRARYAQAWQELQAQFVDDPARAVGQADELVTRLVAERGYPTEDYEDQLAHLSVEHARTLGHYRDAHEIHLRNERGEASTEQLRQAVVHYRTLVADLLGDTSVIAAGTSRTAAVADTDRAAADERAVVADREPVDRDTLDRERDAMDRDAVDRDTVDRDAVDRERDAVDRDAIERDTVDRDTVDRDTVDRDTVDRDAVDRDAVDRDAVDRETVDRETVDRDAVDRDTVDRDAAADASTRPSTRPTTR